MTSAPSQDKFITGQRVALKEPEKGLRYAPRGTVRYVGPVDGHKGEWVGVEWDDPSRGKHDGVVTGKRYFHCEMVPAGTPAGSFVRPQKLTGGVTLRDALLDRYNTSGEDYKAEPIYRALGRRRAMVIEFVSAPANKSGADRAGEGIDTAVLGNDRDASGGVGGSEEKGTQDESMGTNGGMLGGREGREEDKGEPPKRNGMWLSRLQAANVSEVPVGSVGAVGEVAAIASLTELDMSYHLLNTWHETPQNPPRLSIGWANKLGLSNTRVTWAQHLTYLDLSDNRIADWAQVSFLSALPSLKWLLLSGNQITNIPGNDGSPANASTFHNLHHLSLADNNISQWSSIDALAITCPNLKRAGATANGSLTPGSDGAAAADGEEGGRVERCEFGLGVTEEGRMGVIARMGSIQKLNCVQALDLVSERRKLLPGVHANASTAATLAPGSAGAAGGAGSAGSNAADVTASSNHPRSSSFLSITFRVIAPECDSSSMAKEVTKKLPQSTTVSKMRPLIARLLKLEPRSFSLFLLPIPPSKAFRCLLGRLLSSSSSLPGSAGVAMRRAIPLTPSTSDRASMLQMDVPGHSILTTRRYGTPAQPRRTHGRGGARCLLLGRFLFCRGGCHPRCLCSASRETRLRCWLFQFCACGSPGGHGGAASPSGHGSRSWSSSAAPAPSTSTQEANSVVALAITGRYQRLRRNRETVGVVVAALARDTDALVVLLFPEALEAHRSRILTRVRSILRGRDFSGGRVPVFEASAGELLRLPRRSYCRHMLQWPSADDANRFKQLLPISYRSSEGPTAEIKVYQDPAPDFSAAKSCGETVLVLRNVPLFDPYEESFLPQMLGIAVAPPNDPLFEAIPAVIWVPNCLYSLCFGSVCRYVFARIIGHHPSVASFKADPGTFFIGTDLEVEQISGSSTPLEEYGDVKVHIFNQNGPIAAFLA
ncbi:unnamed protein product [Closterium sp. NIES-65]|nr:unnamed protein product [Closterium sp. NIES-65]